MELCIAGGGIAGLTMALTCEQIGIPVSVYEAAQEVRPLGLGIVLQPAAVRELCDLGLRTDLETVGVPVREFALVGRDGADRWSEPRSRDAGFDWPHLAVHRGALEMLLFTAVRRRLGSNAVHTDHTVVGYEHTIDGVVVEMTRSGGVRERVDCDVLVAADGLHSAIRSQMFPGEAGPRWGGSILWRGAASGPPMRTGASFVVVGDARQRFTTFPITELDPETGEQVHNWIAELVFDPRRGWRRDDWNTRVDADEFVDHFEAWRFAWLDVPGLIHASGDVFEYPMVDRDPATHWVNGSVVLIGDAAHAMYPLGSNGASQAIVDARCLGASFVQHGVGRTALEDFESRWLEEMSALVLRNRRIGPASVLDFADGRAADVFGPDGPDSTAELERYVADYGTSVRAAIERLNAAPPTIAPGARVPRR